MDRRPAGRRRVLPAQAGGAVAAGAGARAPDGRAGRRPDPGRAAVGAGRRAGLLAGPELVLDARALGPRLRRGGPAAARAVPRRGVRGAAVVAGRLADASSRTPQEARVPRLVGRGRRGVRSADRRALQAAATAVYWACRRRTGRAPRRASRCARRRRWCPTSCRPSARGTRSSPPRPGRCR